MKPSQLFGVLVRTIGLLVCLSALKGYSPAFLSLFSGSVFPFLAALAIFIPSFAVGLCLLCWPSWLIHFAYPEEKNEKE